MPGTRLDPRQMGIRTNVRILDSRNGLERVSGDDAVIAIGGCGKNRGANLARCESVIRRVRKQGPEIGLVRRITEFPDLLLPPSEQAEAQHDHDAYARERSGEQLWPLIRDRSIQKTTIGLTDRVITHGLGSR
jgi:hypothetical protein